MILTPAEEAQERNLKRLEEFQVKIVQMVANSCNDEFDPALVDKAKELVTRKTNLAGGVFVSTRDQDNLRDLKTLQTIFDDPKVKEHSGDAPSQLNQRQIDILAPYYKKYNQPDETSKGEVGKLLSEQDIRQLPQAVTRWNRRDIVNTLGDIGTRFGEDLASGKISDPPKVDTSCRMSAIDVDGPTAPLGPRLASSKGIA